MHSNSLIIKSNFSKPSQIYVFSPHTHLRKVTEVGGLLELVHSPVTQSL